MTALDEAVVARAGQLLGTTAREVAQLEGSDRWVVVRCDAGDRSVVVKQVRTRQFDWAAGTPTEHVTRFASEVAALQFFAGDAELAARVPPLLAVDLEFGLVVLGDLGEHPSLADVLLGADAAAARQTLHDYAATLGTFAARGHTRVDEFDGTRGYASHFGILQLRKGLDGLELPPQARATVLEVCRALEAARDFFTVGPADACPDNVLVTPDGLRLLDFEGAAVYDALFDAVSLSLPFPSCWCHDAFDPALRTELLATHRRAFGRDDGYDEHLAMATIVWCLWILVRWLDGMRREDFGRIVPGVSTGRQKVRSATAALGRVSTGALQTWATGLDEELAREWGDGSTPDAYPAFR